MLYIGIIMLCVSLIGITYCNIDLKTVVVNEYPHDHTRIVNKYIVFKYMQNGRGFMQYGFMERRDVVQIQSVGDNDKWIDVSWYR